ncbi:NAD(P)/FAD-dependent oxidoreductase [Atopobacter sp. AH10]|uniref:NAD(P)/FAD-dependent oxidoreductase n=1 Tax=Atopobacter sp. AH10 TaxID=2315861 RepID=UPI000EF230E9|nr:NAD(P)/FAD-dependent oxidoreductase [Atopobacter sp. AH10]RLK62775.1 NAD(P)/FAD-dependent oxidoreductase [Atopobacter sp. AH10]
MKEVYDITIIGGGPSGLFAAFYAGLRQAKVKIIDSSPKLGGQPAILYPEKKIYDIAGFSEISAEDFSHNLIQQAMRFSPCLALNQEALDLKQTEEGYYEITSDKEKHFSRAVVIASGAGPFQPRRLDLDKASLYEGHQLHYYVTAIDHFKDKVVAICGGGDSAVDWALTLEKIAKKVYIIHRRDKFRAQEHSVDLLKNSSVEILTPYVPSSLNGDEKHLDSITIKESRGDNTLTIPVDEFIVSYGFSSSLHHLKNWGLNFNGQSIPVNQKMQTSRPGIYAIGDIACYDGKIKIIASGLGEAPTAINNAIAYIHPEERVQPMHSSSLL